MVAIICRDTIGWGNPAPVDIPSWELTYPLLKAFLSRWFSFTPCGFCDRSRGGMQTSNYLQQFWPCLNCYLFSGFPPSTTAHCSFAHNSPTTLGQSSHLKLSAIFNFSNTTSQIRLPWWKEVVHGCNRIVTRSFTGKASIGKGGCCHHSGVVYSYWLMPLMEEILHHLACRKTL